MAPSRKPHRVGQQLKAHRASILVWLGAVGVVALLLIQQQRTVQITGWVEAESVQLMSSRTARVERLAASLLGMVTTGDVLAVLRDEQPRESLAVARAEIERLRSQLDALTLELPLQQQTRQQDGLDLRRRLLVDLESARLRTLELKTILEPDRVSLAELRLRMDAEQSLAEKGLVATLDLQATRAELEALAAKVLENEGLLRQASQDRDQAEARFREFSNLLIEIPKLTDLDRLLDATVKAIRVQELKVSALEQEQAALILTAPFDGQITQIATQEGQVVRAGEAFLTLTSPKPMHVVAYAQGEAHTLREGQYLNLAQHNAPANLVKVRIQSIGKAMVPLPLRLRMDPRHETWGRPLILAIPPDTNLVPGAQVFVTR